MESEIKSWLEKSGYPLELFLASELTQRDYLCGKSELFIDLETGKSREIDVTGYHHGDLDDDYAFARRLIFECKKSEKPILNLCVERKMETIFHHHAFYGDPERADKADAFAYIEYERNSKSADDQIIGGFSKEVYAGYSLVPAFGKSDQDIYSGLMGLVKASTYYRRLYVEHRSQYKNDLSLHKQDRNYFEFHLAALVVDAPLFDVRLDSDGSVNVYKTDWGVIKIQLPWNFDPHNATEGYLVHVVTKDAVPYFLDSVEKLHRYIYSRKNVGFLLDNRPKKEASILSKSLDGIRKTLAGRN